MYIVLEKNWKSHTWKSNRQCVLWFTYDLAWVTNHLWNLSYEGLFKFQHVLLTWLFCRSVVKSQSWASRKNHLFKDSSPKSHTQPLHKIQEKYRETIEQNYNKIWHVIKANIYIVVFFFFCFFFRNNIYIVVNHKFTFFNLASYINCSHVHALCTCIHAHMSS